jgi:hypothetical protein
MTLRHLREGVQTFAHPVGGKQMVLINGRGEERQLTIKDRHVFQELAVGCSDCLTLCNFKQ